MHQFPDLPIFCHGFPKRKGGRGRGKSLGRNKLTLEEEIAAEEEAEERARQAEQDRIKEELQDELRNTGINKNYPRVSSDF